MARILGILAIVFLGLGFADDAKAQKEKHWLIGTWTGELRDFKSNEGAGRTLKVTKVLADGTIEGQWGVTGSKLQKATITLDGKAVKVMTSANSRVELTQQNEKEMQGLFNTASGAARPYRLTLTKE